MLYVLFSAANVEGVDYTPTLAFDNYCRKEWLNTEFAKRVILEVDKSEHIKDNYIESPFLGAIPPSELSTSVKVLLLIKNMDYITDLVFIGENCTKELYEISKTKDIFCTCTNSFIDFYNIPDFECICLNTGDLIKDGVDFVSTMYDLIERPIENHEASIRGSLNEWSSNCKSVG